MPDSWSIPLKKLISFNQPIGSGAIPIGQVEVFAQRMLWS
jgi:hypothetical protein